MQAKIHKAKLITLHNKIADPQIVDPQQGQPTGIHAYMNLLKHLINKNQPNVQSVHRVSSNQGRAKVAVSSNKKKQPNCNFSLLPRNSPQRRISKKDTCLNRQQILQNIMQSSKKLIQVNSFSRLQSKNSNGNQSERVGKYRDDQYRSFVPIGKIYHQLKHKTEIAADYEIKSHMNSSANLKLDSDRVEQRKRFSVYAKQTRSAQHSAFQQQNRVNTERPPMELCAISLRQFAGNGQTSGTRSHSPTPW